MAAPMWTECLEEFIRGQQESGVSRIANDVNSGDVTLLDLVDRLGPYLTSKENNIRGRGTLFLAEILHRLPRNKLTSDEAGLLVTFFCDRLKDHHSVTPHTIYGILSLSKCESLPAGSAVKICLVLFKEVQVQSLVQADRQAFYTVISNFLYARLNELVEMGTEFVYGFVQAMDGEKDPRNLVMAFQIVRTLVDHFPIDIFAEELFEVTSCYFPIDFRPPPNDPYGISTQQLVEGLRRCLAATPKFAEFCLPLLMEKLSSEMSSAKVDAFETLAVCAPVYGAKHLKDYLEAVWSYCRREVFQSLSQGGEQAALDCLATVVKAVSEDKSDEGAPFSLDLFLDGILKESQRHISEPDMRFIHPCCRLLQAVASASEAVCSKVLASVLPLLLDQCSKHPQANQQQNVLSILQAFVRVSLAFPFAEFPNPVSLHKGALVDRLLAGQGETSASLRAAAMAGLSVLAESVGLLAESDVVTIAELMSRVFLSDGDKILRQSSVETLKGIARHYPSVVQNTVLPSLLAQLDSEPMEVDEQGSGHSTAVAPTKVEVLACMAVLARQPMLVEWLVERLLLHLESVGTGSLPSKIDECVGTCQGILTVVTENRTEPSNVGFFLRGLLPEILSKSVRAALTASAAKDDGLLLCQPEVIALLAGIVRNVVQCLEPGVASGLCRQYVDVFYHGDLSCLSSVGSVMADVSFKPLEMGSPRPQSQLVGLLTACLCSVQPGADIPDCSQVLAKLLELATGTGHELTGTSASKCLAGVVNKLDPGSDLDEFIETCKTHLLKGLESRGGEGTTRRRALTCWIWLTKSLLLRSHPACGPLASRLLGWFQDSELGFCAADGLHVILSESLDVLSPSCHADIKLMYRQRLFLQLLPGIIQGYRTTAQGLKRNYLQGLSHLLHFVPRQVLLSELPPLMPLLVQSLHQEDSALYQSALERLAVLVRDAPGVLAQHLDSLLPELLRLAGYQPSLKVRIAALKCLCELVSLEHHIVFPHKVKVARSLLPRLDDKKRNVRNEAVRARNAWLLLGSATK